MMLRRLPVLLPLMLLGGCTCRVPFVAVTPPTLLLDQIDIYQHPLSIHLSKPQSPPRNNILMVYATGDGGWRGLDKELFSWLAAGDFPVAGFSSRSYLKNLGHVSKTTTPGGLVRDFELIIDSAEHRLGLPQDTPIILVGLSRGAGLVVVAAGQGELQAHLAGVVAIALTKEEEHVVHYRTQRHASAAETPKRELVEIKTYEYLPRLGNFPVAVIQSTKDHYLPARAARALFGPDTDVRRFLAVQARNHRFSGGCATLCQDTFDSVAWVREKLAQHLCNVPH